MVYGAAVRLVREPDSAKDVAQLVFIELANKAHSIREGNALPGWLYRTTCRTAANFLRAEARRHEREGEAVIQSQIQRSESAAESDVAPMLDDAMQSLSDAEQNVIVRRFFEGESLRDVGRALALSEDAAQKRVARALEKLRAHVVRKGVAVSSATLASALAAGSAQAAPIGLAANLTTAALAGCSVSSAGIISSSLLMMKTQTVVLLAAGAIAITTPFVIQHQSLKRLQADNELKNQELDLLRDEIDRLSTPTVVLQEPSENLQALNSELLRLRSEATRLRGVASDLQQRQGEARQVSPSREAIAEWSKDHPVFSQPYEVRRKYAEERPLSALAFQGHATPQDAMLSVLWALKEQNTEVLWECLTVEAQTTYVGKSFNDLAFAAGLPGNYGELKSIQLAHFGSWDPDRSRMTGDVYLHFPAGGFRRHTMELIKIEGSWRINRL
jgi:RNA polymerase sigma factor (sigma-70 family)